VEVHLRKAAGLTPPGLSSEAVAAWRAAAEALAAAWNLQRSEVMHRWVADCCVGAGAASGDGRLTCC
jgi:hypothetical protein